MQSTATTLPLRRFQEEHGIIGESPAMRKIVEVIQQVAPTEITVLVTGESGTGKEVIAKAIHAASLRNKKLLVTVNCGAIPEGIIESELFGHERGSFTGASDQRKGYFELADGGTIFLDEIGELPLPAQVKFLRVLENGEFLRVGSSVARRVDVRVIAATNKDLELEVQQNRFRTDLFYRLRSVNITVPPLRARREDIPLLVKAFSEEVCARNGIAFEGVSNEAMDVLMQYPWPGNVRELRNVVESMIVLEKGRRVDVSDLGRYLREFPHPAEERNLPVHVGRSVEQAERELILRALLDIKSNIVELRKTLERQPSENWGRHGTPVYPRPGQEPPSLSLQEMERRMIIEALERFNGNRRAAARALSISERTLYRKIHEYGLT